jgi:hypothetical protein
MSISGTCGDGAAVSVGTFIEVAPDVCCYYFATVQGAFMFRQGNRQCRFAHAITHSGTPFARAFSSIC